MHQIFEEEERKYETYKAAHKVESNKQHALVMFATILAITGVGFALWFNFSDQGQTIIR